MEKNTDYRAMPGSGAQQSATEGTGHSQHVTRIKRNERGREASCLRNIEKAARNVGLTLTARNRKEWRRKRRR
jgi:hypothetical protein